MKPIELLPSLRKRLILLSLVIAFGIAVTVIAPFLSSSFTLFFGLALAAFCYCVVRLFNREPVLMLSEAGIFSKMTINAGKIGLIYWSDITEIRETKRFWVINGIELHTGEEVAERYNSRINGKYRSGRKTLLIYLSNDEINMTHKELFVLVNRYWDHYRINN
ncbi:STM3941 family protein [Chryseobacterium sp. Leaf201]|uniref:STM3941 family protein n=1 Tax=Chryseobacterium sp. Leaf201 TaxID=1735672 RepID=UPI00070032C3|nr:STM3941 family protein [Chryseobacterium sp. Leaf201]KQM50114.1 hypothetical protein ASE55_09585 [Chryseobacterium sp. Leaf201]